MGEQILGDGPAPFALLANKIGLVRLTLSKRFRRRRRPLISLIGRVVTPGLAMSNRTKLMPSCLLPLLSVRTRQKIQSALSA